MIAFNGMITEVFQFFAFSQAGVGTQMVGAEVRKININVHVLPFGAFCIIRAFLK